MSAGVLGVALVVRVLLVPVLPAGMAFVTFLPAVLLICFLFGARLGAAAAVASVALAWGFFIHDPLQPGMLGAVPAVVPFAVLATLNLLLFHWMQRANAKLRAERARSAALAETREILFRELQHRVSNNLQVAAGLLALQKKHVADAAARDALEEASQRLAVIGRTSRQLYDPAGGTRGMRDFLAPLCADIVAMSGRDGIALDLRADEDLLVEPDAAMPLALIVAEAVANAIEHGLANRPGRIEVVLARDGDGSLRVEVRDDGAGLPEGFDPAARASLGLKIMRELAEQLGGRFELVGGGSTTARLVLPG
ncbi:MAG: sensor histidine kinase [Sphingomonas sp.]